MDINEYSRLALRTASDDNPILHACLGIGGESGEILDYVKKGAFYGKEVTQDHLIEEAGDLVWYVNLLLHGIGATWEQVLERNIAKLEARYPDLRFEADHAINRDKEAEREAMAACNGS